jgi:Putative zinc-finger
MSACGFDAAMVASSLGGDLSEDARARVEGHLAGCRECRASAIVYATARRAWRGAMERDDAGARALRERRLIDARLTRRPRMAAPAQLATSAALGGLAVALWLGNRHEPLPAPPAAAAPSAVAAPAAPAPLQLQLEEDSPVTAPAAPRAAPQLVTARTCAGCRAARTREPLDAGMTLPAAAVDVPPGNTLVLGWSIGEGAAVAGTAVDVLGPARVHALPSRPWAIFVERGTAVADATAEVELESPRVRSRGAHASWRVDVSAERTRIDVMRGEIVVEAGGAPARTLRAGDRVDLAPPATSAPHAPEARPLPVAAPPASVAAPPAPVDPPDEARVFEAASGAARATTRNTERAAIWRNYLQRSPRAPYADLAMATLAEVLLDMGANVEARVVVDAASARPPIPEAASVLERARGRLTATSAVECLEHDVRKLPAARKR